MLAYSDSSYRQNDKDCMDIIIHINIDVFSESLKLGYFLFVSPFLFLSRLICFYYKLTQIRITIFVTIYT